ncbi:MAG: hypothetical protein NT069_02395 [Planctomycetota bacterium]|nr:hypothetical protein [Planctomycetota bacterium]
MRRLSQARSFSNPPAVCSRTGGQFKAQTAAKQWSRTTAHRPANIAGKTLERRRDPRYEVLFAAN